MLSTLWKTCKWLTLLVVLLVIGAGVCGVYLWKQSDELLHQAVIDGVHKWAPDVKVGLNRVSVDRFGQVHLEDLQLTLPDETAPLFAVDACVIDLDRDAFLERQEVIVQNVKLTRPRVLATRAVDGRWNFQKLPPLPEGKKGALPSCLVEEAEVVVQLADANSSDVRSINAKPIRVSMTPKGKRSLQVDGNLVVERIGELGVTGNLNLDSMTGSVSGTLNGVRVGRDLLNYVSSFEPKVLAAVAGVEEKIRAEMYAEPDPKAASPFSIRGIARNDWVDPVRRPGQFVDPQTGAVQMVSASTVVPNAISHSIPVGNIGGENSILGLNLELNLSFKLDRPQPDQMPIASVACDIVGGEITNTALAFPLLNLTGHVELGDDKLTITRLNGSNGPTEIDIRGEINSLAATPSGRIGVKLKNIGCDDRLRRRLSIGFGKIYDANHLEGFLDMEAVVASDEAGKWKPESFTVSANRCKAMHDLFPYQVQDAVGTIKQIGTDLVIDLQGFAGRQPISLKGRVRNPGPNAWIQLDIAVNDLPIDDRFIDACPPPLRKTITSMSLKGLVNGQWHLEKKPGEGQPFVPNLEGVLHDGSMNYGVFPYRVDGLSGRLSFDGKTWTFNELRGVHGGARLAAAGYYSKQSGVGDLNMTVVTEDAPIDETLYEAVPQNLKTLWGEFQPTGTIKHCETHIRWIENRPVVISLPKIEISKGRALLRRFPYEMTDIEATFDYVPGVPQRTPAQLNIKTFEGRHDGAWFVINPDGGKVTLSENGDWKVRLQNWQARELKPNADLRRAVSTGLKTIVGAFNPDQPIEVEGMLELRGSADPRRQMTAAWSLVADIAGNDISAGLDFRDVHGQIKSAGTWDGYEAVVDGELKLASLKVFQDYELTEVRGPFRFRNGMISFGSLEALEGGGDRVVDPQEQISAEFVQGLLTINGLTSIEEVPEHHVRVNFSHGQLETFARSYLDNRDRLRGTMNGWLNLRGRGADSKNLEGTGQLQISPAALYEMPVVLQLLTALTPQAANAAAFSYALVNFRMNNARYLFDAIDLVGESIQLRGKGEATFAGDLNLTFYSMLPYSMLPKNQLPIWVPVVTEVSNLVRTATREVTKGWVVVEVKGKIEHPETQIVPAGNFKGFLGTLRPLPLAPQPIQPGPPLARQKSTTLR